MARTRTSRRFDRVPRRLTALTPLASAAALALACSAAPLAQAGDYGWSDGTFSSTGIPTLLTINDTLTLSCPVGGCGAKMLNADLQNNGYVFAYDDLRFYQGNTLTNRWQVELHGDVGLLDTYGGNLFVNQGALVKASGSGNSWVTVSSTHSASALVDAISGDINFGAGTASFASGATLLAAQGAGIVFSGGTAAFADGVRFAGAGQYTMATTASFGGTVAAQNLVFRDATWSGGDGSAGSRATLASNAGWSGGGSFSGQWQVAAGSTLSLQGSGAKYIGQSSSLVNDGSIAATDHLRLYYFSNLVNNGSYRFEGDVGIQETYGYGGVRNDGALVKTAGSGTSAINAAYSGSGSVDARTGSIEFASGSTRFEDGTEFKGAGTVLVSHDASFAGKIRSQNLLLTNGTWTGGDGSADSSASSQAQLDGRATWAATGTLAGRWQIAPQSTLTLAGGGSSGTKTIGQSATLTNDGTVEAGDHLRLFYFSSLVNNGSWRLNGDVGLYETYGYSSVANRGELVKTAGSGSSAITVSFNGGAGSSVDVRQGGIDFQAGDHSFASGAAFKAAAGTAISFSGGTSQFADGVRFDGAGQYTVANSARFLGAVGAQQLLFKDGSWTGGDGTSGSAATLTSDATWAGAGTLAGTWRTAAGTTLALVAGSGTKTLGQSATLTNDGTVEAGDHLRFFYFSSLVNNGSWRLNGDVGLYETYGYSSVTNAGTLSKVAGSGSSVINVAFSNRGTVDAQTGSIEFNAGNANFEDGSRFTGAGVVQVNGNARFNGGISAQNLVLTNGTWTGGDGSAGSAARLGGTARWEGSGALAGNWELAERSTLTLAGGASGGGTKTIAQSATLTNLGTIEARDNLQLFYFSTLVNRGSYHFDGDVGLSDTYGYSQVVNEGSIVKTAGSGSSAIAVAFTNLGSVEVRSGSIALPADFSNAGLLTGSGSFATNRLTNNGHVGPSGASTYAAQAQPATLTIAGHFSQTAAGTLDIGLLDLAHSDRLLVLGDVQLGGTLALHCLGACSFAAGDDVLVLDGSGNLSGSFASVSLSGFRNDSGSGSFDLVYDLANADVWLHATSNVASAVPEPSPYALLLAGIGVIGWLARRQR